MMKFLMEEKDVKKMQFSELEDYMESLTRSIYEDSKILKSGYINEDLEYQRELLEHRKYVLETIKAEYKARGFDPEKFVNQVLLNIKKEETTNQKDNTNER